MELHISTNWSALFSIFLRGLEFSSFSFRSESVDLPLLSWLTFLRYWRKVCLDSFWALLNINFIEIKNCTVQSKTIKGHTLSFKTSLYGNCWLLFWNLGFSSHRWLDIIWISKYFAVFRYCVFVLLLLASWKADLKSSTLFPSSWQEFIWFKRSAFGRYHFGYFSVLWAFSMNRFVSSWLGRSDLFQVFSSGPSMMPPGVFVAFISFSLSSRWFLNFSPLSLFPLVWKRISSSFQLPCTASASQAVSTCSADR